MVQSLFKCEECGAVYNEYEIATKCEEHCKEFNACDVDYLRKSIGTISINRLHY